MKINLFGIIFLILVILFAVFMVGILIKAKNGDLAYYETNFDTNPSSPFETSNNTSRYALTESLVSKQSVFLDERMAKFSAPDVVKYNDKFFSIFTPGVSFLLTPFYMLGEKFGYHQLATYSATILFSIINVALIIKISLKLGASLGASIMAGLTFLFATNALVYALTITQHHYTITVLLLMVLNSFGERTVGKNMAIGALFGIGLLFDMPNLFLSFPAIAYVIWKHLSVNYKNKSLKVSFKYIVLWILVGLAPFLVIFAGYNYMTTGSYLKVAQFIGQYRGGWETPVLDNNTLDQTPASTERLESRSISPTQRFKTRKLLHGFQVLLLGDERSWRYYSPVILLSFAGFLFHRTFSQEKQNIVYLLFSIFLVNVLIYALFGDPWGGWAFGSRYLIPSAAILSPLLAIAIDKYKRSVAFMILFTVLLIYSVRVSTLGALTTAAIPPRVEAESLPNPIPHNYQYNIEFIRKNITSALGYNFYFSKHMDVKTFWNAYAGVIIGMVMLPYAMYLFFNVILNPKPKLRRI